MTSASTLFRLATLSGLGILPLAACQGGGGTTYRTPAESALSEESRAAIRELQGDNPAAAALAKEAKAVLVFPDVVKGGFIIGAFHGQGVMFKGDTLTGYYNTGGGSYGLQAGLQKFAYAMYFLKDSDLKYLEESKGWEIGIGPNVTVVDEGIARSLTTTSGRSGVYVFFFDQKGLMAGLGLQGSKITRIDR